MENADVIRHEMRDVARMVLAESLFQRQRRGRDVSPHDLSVQLSVAHKILQGEGRAMRLKYLGRSAYRDNRG